MSSPVSPSAGNKPTILDQAHDAVADAIAREAKDSIQLDVDFKGAEASLNTTKKGWTFTAYVRKAWQGAFSGGLRASKPLSILSRD